MTTFPKHACQKCGCESKWIETLIDDQFSWNELTLEWEAQGFGDDFSHTGTEVCVECNADWTGEDYTDEERAQMLKNIKENN